MVVRSSSSAFLTAGLRGRTPLPRAAYGGQYIGASAGEHQRLNSELLASLLSRVHRYANILRGIEAVNRGITVNIYVNTPHKIMLAGKYGNPVAGDVNPFLKTAGVYHREAAFDKGFAAVGDVQIKILARRQRRLLNNASRYDITRRKLAPLVIVVHKAFAIAVEQIGALPAYRFGYKKTFLTLRRCKGGGVELDQMEALILAPSSCAKVIRPRSLLPSLW